MDATSPPFAPNYRTIDGPGEYELQNVFVTGARSYQTESRDDDRLYNTMYVVEVEGLKIGHLGNIGHTLSEAQAEPLEDVDILVVPVGGEQQFTYDKAVDLVTKLDTQGRDPDALPHRIRWRWPR